MKSSQHQVVEEDIYDDIYNKIIILSADIDTLIKYLFYLKQAKLIIYLVILISINYSIR